MHGSDKTTSGFRIWIVLPVSIFTYV